MTISKGEPVRTHTYAVLNLGLALAAACASAHPDFEQEFYASDRATQDAWYQLLSTRYGCDRLAVVNSRRTLAGSLVVGSPVCIVAAFVMPQRIRAWKDRAGVREEWEFRGGTAGQPAGTSVVDPFAASVPCVLELAGDRPVALKVTGDHC